MPRRVEESDSEGEAEFNTDEENGNEDNEPEEEDEEEDEEGDEEEDGDDDDNDEDEGSVDSDAPKKRKSAPKRTVKAARSPAAKRQKVNSSTRKARPSTSSSNKTKTPKVLRKFDRLEDARKAFKWWEAEELPNGIQWRHMEHAGIVFPPPYTPHHIPLLYDGKEVQLTPEQEEIATFYAAIPEDGPQLGNPKTRPVFQKNFFADFKQSLPSTSVIKHFDKCDFSAIREYLALQKSLRKAASEEEKMQKKIEKEDIQLHYGYALIDGRMEKMGNYNMEPPGLFRGRGEHPLTGTVKRRCFSESVAINCSVDSAPPRVPLPGHAWESVRHDPTVTWLCNWHENVQDQNKYVMLAASSSFKGKSDMDKYAKAIKLRKYIAKVRKDYTAKINSSDKRDRQLGVAMWVIDVLALRVGGEKGEDEADTVGCCSLRLEHLNFNPDPSTFEIELEFLGKDSMLYKQNINFAQHGELGKKVYHCLKSFCAGKGKDKGRDSQVFDTLTPMILNKHLTSIMKGLTAKVFRTYNASITLQEELPSAEDLADCDVAEKVIRYNAANRQVAILCNHQKTVSKATETMFENLNEKLEMLNRQRTELIQWKEWAEAGKERKIPLRSDDSEMVAAIVADVKAAMERKEKARTQEEKLQAAQALEDAKANQKNDQKRRAQEKHMYKTCPNVSSLEAKIERWTADIRKLETDIRNRDENKEVALGTSKINYMDPRISVAWCKRCEVPIDKVFAKTLRDKFNWAMAVPPDWKFE